MLLSIMRIIARSILNLVISISLSLGLLAGTVKFQLLDYNFWKTSFEKHDVYQNLAAASRSSLDSQIENKGGKKSDARVFTDLITTENVRDFLDKNIKNTLSFMNGKSLELYVYLPVKIIPNGLLPKNLTASQGDIPLQDLLTKLNYQNVESLPIKNLSRVEYYATLVLVCSILLLAVAIYLSVLLVEEGRRFTSLGVTMLLFGLSTFFVSRVGGRLGSFPSADPTGTPSFASVLVNGILPPLVDGFTVSWSIVGVAFIVIGLALFFVRKPRYNIPK